MFVTHTIRCQMSEEVMMIQQKVVKPPADTTAYYVRASSVRDV